MDDVESEIEPIEQVIEEVETEEPEQEEIVEEQPKEKTMVPLSALQKVKEKKRELELELQWERQRNAQKEPEPEEDDSRYESATKEDLGKNQEETLRILEERMWIRQNPEKYEEIEQNLTQFLKQRPHLAHAIKHSPNRYEEAYTLMNALTQKQQKQMKAPVKSAAPNAPSSVPKGASLSHSVDVMGMSDKEFNEWRASQRKRR